MRTALGCPPCVPTESVSWDAISCKRERPAAHRAAGSVLAALLLSILFDGELFFACKTGQRIEKRAAQRVI